LYHPLILLLFSEHKAQKQLYIFVLFTEYYINCFLADIKEEKCISLPKKEDHNALPYSGRSCQNWQNLSNNAKNDFDKMFSSIRISLENSNVCKKFGKDISWCYVNDPDEFLREPCFLHRKLLFKHMKKEIEIQEKYVFVLTKWSLSLTRCHFVSTN
jgi:hypothetical protein